MLAIAGKNDHGDVLHCIMGPESEMVLSMEGYCVVEITDILKSLHGSDKVWLKFTRTLSELQTFGQARSMGIACEASNIRVKTSDDEDERDKPVPCSAGQQNKCSACGGTAATLELNGKQYCAGCIAIELGLKRGNDAQASTEHDGTAAV